MAMETPIYDKNLRLGMGVVRPLFFGTTPMFGVWCAPVHHNRPPAPKSIDGFKQFRNKPVMGDHLNHGWTQKKTQKRSAGFSEYLGYPFFIGI